MTDRIFHSQYPPPSYSQAVTPPWASINSSAMSQQYAASYQPDPYTQPSRQQQQYPQPTYVHTQQLQPCMQQFPATQPPPSTQYPQQYPQPQQPPTTSYPQPQVQPLQQYAQQQSPCYSQQAFPGPPPPLLQPAPGPGSNPSLQLHGPHTQQGQQYPPPQHILQQVIIQPDKQGPGHIRTPPGHARSVRPTPPPPHVLPPRPMPPSTSVPQKKESGKLLNSLGRAVDFMAKKAKNNIARDVSNTFYSPLELLKPGYVVQLVSKLTGKSLRVMENGLLDCTQNKGSACEFTVAASAGNNSAIKFRSVSQPQFYLAIVNGYTVGYGLGGIESDFIPMMTPDYHVTLESVMMPGAHIGVLPSGQLTDPAQTNKMTDAAHFKVKYLRNS